MSTAKKHNEFWTRLHNLVTRCYCKSSTRYKDYGGRGIRVWNGWYDEFAGKYNVDEFKTWCINHGYKPGLHIDRIDNDGNYSPCNCRFVTAAENSRNRRNTIRINLGGKEQCAKDWCAELGVSYMTFGERVLQGWDHRRAILIPTSWRRPHLCFFKGSKKGLRPHCYRGWHRSLSRHEYCNCETEEQMRDCPYFHEFTYEDLKSGWLNDRDRGLMSPKV